MSQTLDARAPKQVTVVPRHNGDGEKGGYTYTWSNGDVGPTTTAGFGLPPLPVGYEGVLSVIVVETATGKPVGDASIPVTISQAK